MPPQENLDWLAFFLLCGGLGLLRALALPLLPFRIVSASFVVTTGFVCFLAVPLLGYSQLISISPWSYGLHVCLAFASAIIGLAIASRLGHRRVASSSRADIHASLKFARIFWLAWALVPLLALLTSNGIARIRDVAFGGFAHRAEVDRIGEFAAKLGGALPSGIGSPIGDVALHLLAVALWGLLFPASPALAILLWFARLIPSLGGYWSRSELLSSCAVPLIAYLAVFRPRRSRILAAGAVSALLLPVFLAWNVSVRVGNEFDATASAVLRSAIRDVGDSGLAASRILSENIRGNPASYGFKFVSFAIPRALWPSKPGDDFNYRATEALTGLEIGRGISVTTSTILGEAWFYFGPIGSVIIPMLFGFSAGLAESVFRRRASTIGLLYYLLPLAFIQMRSTFFTFYQNVVLSLGMALLLRAFSLFRFHRPGSSSPRDISQGRSSRAPGVLL